MVSQKNPRVREGPCVSKKTRVYRGKGAVCLKKPACTGPLERPLRRRALERARVILRVRARRVDAASDDAET